MEIFQIRNLASSYSVVKQSFSPCHGCFSILDSLNQKIGLSFRLPFGCWVSHRISWLSGCLQNTVSEGSLRREASVRNNVFQRKGFDVGDLT